ncbi:MAG: dihydropteroate synthase [bacterium]
MRIGSLHLDSGKPAIMGIVNTTPDSFSDGGQFSSIDDAIDYGLRLVDEGADVIDVGGESTRPGSAPVSLEEELGRVIPVIEGMRKRCDIPISIDTSKAIVACRAMEAGASMINDVSAGRFDPELFACAARAGVPICLMHMNGTPRNMQEEPRYNDLMSEITAFLSDAISRAVSSGVHRNNIMIDPGIGFGKSVSDNVTILRRLADLCDLNAPIVIGTSRKSFIGKILDVDVENRLEGTLATLAVAIDNGASILRVHDVAPAKRFTDMYFACRY